MKKIIALVLALVCVLGLVGCNTQSMNYIIENKPSVVGVVEEVHNDYVIMYSDTADGYPNGTRWSISLNVENKDSYTDIVVGDEIVVYYDGMAAETDPLQVNTVYAITLRTPADRTINKPVVMNGIYAEVTALLDNGSCEVVVTGKDSNFDIGDTLVIHYNTIRGNSDEVEKQLEVGDTIAVTYEKLEEKDGSIHIAVEYVDLKPTE